MIKNNGNERTENTPKKQRVDECNLNKTQSNAPFEVANFEYAKLDILLENNENKICGRPWLTLLIDEFSGSLLAFHLSLNSPSFESNLMVIRECVKKYSKLPNTLIIPGGREFWGKDFLHFAEAYSMTIKKMPMGKKSLSRPEKLFSSYIRAAINDIFYGARRAQTVRNKTNFTFDELKDLLKRYFEIHDQKVQPALNYKSPREVLQNGLLEFGQVRYISYDENLKIMTSVSPKKRNATLYPDKGIKINDINYWSEELKSLSKQQVPVKYDPQDINTAYAYIAKKWIRLCKESKSNSFNA